MSMRKKILPALLALLYFALPSTQADVYVLTKSYILEPLPSLQADFGPPISAEGVDGVLRMANPLDACSPFTFTDTKQPWVALISREQRHKSIECTFDLKVRHAEQAGAQAAIVYDDLYESLIIMSKPQEHPDPGIPSVFVSEKAGLLLMRLLQLDEVHVRITPVSAVAWISMVMSAFLGLLAMTIVFSSFYVMRTWSYWLTHGHHPRQQQAGGAGGTGSRAQQNQGLPPEVLRSFPVIVHESKPSPPSSPRPSDDAERSSPHLERKGTSCNSSDCEVPLPPGVHAGETKRMCTICLEHYEDGDKVRILPCYHRFHMQCIDAWLSGRSACPVCKHDASQPLQAVLDVQSAEGTLQQLEGGGTAGTDVEQAAAPQRRWWSPLLRIGGVRSAVRWLRRQQAPQQHEEDPLLAAAGSRTSPANTDIEAGGGIRLAAAPQPTPAPDATTATGSLGAQTTELPQQQQAGLELEQQQTQATHASRVQLLREQQAQALRQWEELQRQLPEAEQQPLTASAAPPPSPPSPAPAGANRQASAAPAAEQERRGEVVSAAEELVRESVAATRAAAAASGLNEVLTPEAAAMMEEVAARQARAAAASSSLQPQAP